MLHGSLLEAALILLVEDDNELRELFADLLEAAGFIVTAIPRAEDAARALRPNHPPELIVLDLGMPRGTMQGMEFLAMIREVNAWKHTPVVILSGYGDIVNPDITTRLGVAAVLSKPLTDADALPRTVRAILH